jgi:hypothetical protein
MQSFGQSPDSPVFWISGLFGGYFRLVADFGRGPAARGGDQGKTFSLLFVKDLPLGFDEDWGTVTGYTSSPGIDRRLT